MQIIFKKLLEVLPRATKMKIFIASLREYSPKATNATSRFLSLSVLGGVLGLVPQNCPSISFYNCWGDQERI